MLIKRAVNGFIMGNRGQLLVFENKEGLIKELPIQLDLLEGRESPYPGFGLIAERDIAEDWLIFMIKIKNENEIEIMRQGGKILASVLSSLIKELKPGIETRYLDEIAEALIYQHGALPAFKGHDGYPAALCTSVNEEIVHGVPSDRKLLKGDIVGLDLFDQEVMPVVNFFEQEGFLIKVNGEQSIEDVQKEILEKID